MISFPGQNEENASLLSDEILSAKQPQHATQNKGFLFIKSEFVSTLCTKLRLPSGMEGPRPVQHESR